MGVKLAHSAKCYNSYALTKVTDLILDIESFEQQCVILKGLLQTDRLKKHIVTIVIYELLSNFAMYKYIIMENMNEV